MGYIWQGCICREVYGKFLLTFFCITILGFGDKLKLAFYIMGGERRLPSASTCYKQLQLPRDIDTSDETAFFDIMITAILESQGFGKV